MAGHFATAISLMMLGAPSDSPADETSASALPIVKGEVLIVGETHGTREGPAEFSNLLRSVAAGGNVVLGLELAPESAQLPCDRRPESLPETWSRVVADGRSSLAMHDLLCDAKSLAESDGVRIVYLVDEKAAGDFDAAAAGKFLDEIRAEPGATGVILVGNFHARNQGRSLAPPIRAAGYRVATATLSTQDPKAAAWQCQNSGCGVHPVALNFCQAPAAPAAQWLPSADPRWDYCLIMPGLTPSPPLAEESATAKTAASGLQR